MNLTGCAWERRFLFGWRGDRWPNRSRFRISEYERLKDLVQQADARHGLEMAALERRYQEKIAEMERMHQAEITRLENVIAHQAEQVKEMAAYGVKIRIIQRSWCEGRCCQL